MSFFDEVEYEEVEGSTPQLEALPEITEEEPTTPNVGKYSIAPGFGSLPSVRPDNNYYKTFKDNYTSSSEGDVGSVRNFRNTATGQVINVTEFDDERQASIYNTVQDALKGELINMQTEAGGVGSGFDVSRSDDPIEVFNKLQDQFPDYDIKPVEIAENDHIFMMKGPRDRAYKPFNREGFSGADVGAGLGFVLDEQNASAIVGSMFSAGAAIPIRFASVLGSEFIGSMTKQQVEAARGYQEQDLGEQTSRATLDASIGLAIDIPTSGALRMGDVFTGRRGLMDAQPLSREAYGIMKKYDLPTLTPGQMSVLYSRKEAQLAQFDDRPGYRYDEQAQALLTQVNEMAKNEIDLGILGQSELGDLHAETTQKYLRAISTPEMSPYKAGKQVQEAYDKALSLKAEHFNAEYPKVYEMASGDVTYDASPLKDLSSKWTFSTKMQGEEVTKDLPDTVSSKLSGTTRTATERLPDVEVDRDLRERTKMLFKKLDQIDPDIGDYKGSSGLEQLHKLRQQFDNIAFSDEFRGSVDQKAAREARSKISAVIENAQGGGEVFQKSFKDVNAQYRDYAEGKKLSWARKMMDADDPAVLVRQFTSPNSAAELGYFKSVLPEEEYVAFQQAAGTSLLRDPKNLSRNIRELEKDPDTFNLLFSKPDQDALRVTANQIDLLENTSVVKSLERMRTDIENAKYIAKNSTEGELDEYLKQGGEPLARTLRAGILAEIQQKVVSSDMGVIGTSEIVTKADRNKFATLISEYQQDPVFKKIFSLDSQKKLSDLKLYAQATSLGSGDTGAALQGASVIGKLGFGDLITRPDEVGAALIKIYGTKREVGPWLSPKFNALIFGGTKDRLTTSATVRGAATAVTQGMKDFINHSETVSGEFDLPEEPPVEVPEGFESPTPEATGESIDFFDSIEFDELEGSSRFDSLGGIDSSPKVPFEALTSEQQMLSSELTGGLRDTIKVSTPTSKDPVSQVSRASEKFGEYYTRIAQLESSGGKDLFNETSKAYGVLQFMPKTWEYHAKRAGVDVATAQEATPEEYAKVADDFTEMNASVLRKYLKREPNSAELYLAHHFGGGGAKNMMRAVKMSPKKSARAVLGKSVYKSNKNLIGDKSIKELYEYIQKSVMKGQWARDHQLENHYVS